jgi:hypothetical protein
MAYPYSSGSIPRQSDEEFASWLAGRGHDVMSFLDESGARANPAAHPLSTTKKIGDAVRSPQEAAAAMAPPTRVDPIMERIKRDAAMNDYGLAANQRTAAQMDETDRAYQMGAGVPDPSPEELRHALGFSWGKGVDVDPATGRPRSNSTISTWDPSQGRTTIAANESAGGGGVSTLGQAPPFRNVQPWQVEDVGRAADVTAAERSIEEPLWLQRAVAGLDVEKAGAIEGNRARILAGTEAGRREEFMTDLNNEDDMFRQAMTALEHQQRTLPADEYAKKRTLLEQRYQTRRAAVRQAHGFGEKLSTASLYAEQP